MSRGPETKSQCLETFHRSADRIQQTVLLCKQQDTQRTGDLQPCRDCMPACVAIIQHEQMIGRLQPQSEDLLLSVPQACNERQQSVITHRLH